MVAHFLCRAHLVFAAQVSSIELPLFVLLETIEHTGFEAVEVCIWRKFLVLYELFSG